MSDMMAQQGLTVFMARYQSSSSDNLLASSSLDWIALPFFALIKLTEIYFSSPSDLPALILTAICSALYRAALQFICCICLT